VIEPLTWLTPLIVLVIIGLFGFVGCVGDEAQWYSDGQTDEKTAVQTQVTAAKYENVVLATSGLVSYWRLSEGETGNPIAPDSGPAKIDGMYQNPMGVSRNVAGALSIVNEPGDKAAQFDGVQGYMEVPFDGRLNPPLSFSLEFWILPATLPNPQMVLCSYVVDANGNMITGYTVEVNWTGPGTPQLLVRIGNGLVANPATASTSLQADLGDGLEHGGWRHVVVTYNAISKSLKIYVNSDTGSIRAQLTPPGDPPVYYQANPSAPLRVAAGWSETSEPTPLWGTFTRAVSMKWPCTMSR